REQRSLKKDQQPRTPPPPQAPALLRALLTYYLTTTYYSYLHYLLSLSTSLGRLDGRDRTPAPRGSAGADRLPAHDPGPRGLADGQGGHRERPLRPVPDDPGPSAGATV